MSAQKQKVLFIEPHEELHAIYRAVIKPEIQGWELQFAVDGAQGLALHDQAPVDLLIVSDSLPDRPGLTVLDEMKTRSPGTLRFLLVSSDDVDRPSPMVGSAQQVLVTPLNPTLFTQQVNQALSLRSLIDNPEILKLIGDSHSLPALPRVFAQLDAKLSSPNVYLNDVAEIISQDVVLSSKVLRMVNSALFNLRSRVENLTQAVSLLGTGTIRSMVFAQGVADSFGQSHANERFFEKLNRHSIVCAKTVEKLLYEWGSCRRMIDQAVFCCFAHDLGKMILSRYEPDKWNDTLNGVRAGEETDVCLERRLIGVGHPEIAAYLLAFWGFSNDQISAVAFHHEPQFGQQNGKGILCALHLVEHTVSADFQSGHLDAEWLATCGLSEDEIVSAIELGELISARDADGPFR